MNERPKALTDAECRAATLADICCTQAGRIAKLEAILVRINEHADVMRNQVGTGQLVSDIRHGFDTIVQMTREAHSK
jgi:myo-inositol catabolism protein IolC